MSFLPSVVSFVGGIVDGLLSPTLFMGRNIGGIVADVTVEENHTDELVITEHPVEQGADITDHAYKRPSSVTIKCAWSNSSSAALGSPFYVQLVYTQLLALQSSLQPFSITTGKRTYDNMLLKRLSVLTDEKNEFALDVTAECQEILIASTQTVSTGSGDAANMADPVQNAGTANTGTQSATDVTGQGSAPKRVPIALAS